MAPATSSNETSLTLPTDEQILIKRRFEAPRHLVYRAWTTPDLVKQWWHANRGHVTEVEIDLRAGGRWRQAMVTPDGFEVAFHGEYLEVVPEERIVSTEIYEGLPEGVSEQEAAAVNTLTFSEDDGGTAVTLLIEAKSKAARDAIIDSGMEDGLRDALTLLEAVARAHV